MLILFPNRQYVIFEQSATREKNRSEEAASILSVYFETLITAKSRIHSTLSRLKPAKTPLDFCTVRTGWRPNIRQNKVRLSSFCLVQDSL